MKHKGIQLKKEKLLEALEQTLGVVTTACKKANIDRQSYYRWINTDRDFRLAVEEIDNVALDFAESQLHKQIKKESTAATIFYLKTKGKKRGYVERQEISGVKGQPTAFQIEIIDNKDKVEDKGSDE